MSYPLISVIIPVYNGSNYLAEAIESVLNQSNQNFELIVVNDGSDDGGLTEKIALSFGERLKYICIKHSGVSAALNIGLKNSSSQLFMWLSHDDIFMPNMLENQIKYYSELKVNNSKVIIASSAHLINSKNKPMFRPKKALNGVISSQTMCELILSGKSICGCSLLLPKKAVIEIGGFSEKHKYIQDKLCWFKLAELGYDFYFHGNDGVYIRLFKGQSEDRLKSALKSETIEFLSDYANNHYQSLINNRILLKKMLVYAYRLTPNTTIDILKNMLKTTKTNIFLTVIYCKSASVVYKLKQFFKKACK